MPYYLLIGAMLVVASFGTKYLPSQLEKLPWLVALFSLLVWPIWVPMLVIYVIIVWVYNLTEKAWLEKCRAKRNARRVQLEEDELMLRAAYRRPVQKQYQPHLSPEEWMKLREERKVLLAAVAQYSEKVSNVDRLGTFRAPVPNMTMESEGLVNQDDLR